MLLLGLYTPLDAASQGKRVYTKASLNLIFSAPTHAERLWRLNQGSSQNHSLKAAVPIRTKIAPQPPASSTAAASMSPHRKKPRHSPLVPQKGLRNPLSNVPQSTNNQPPCTAEQSRPASAGTDHMNSMPQRVEDYVASTSHQGAPARASQAFKSPNRPAVTLTQPTHPQTQSPTAKNEEPNFPQLAPNETEKGLSLVRRSSKAADGLGGHDQQLEASCLAEKGSPQIPIGSNDRTGLHLSIDSMMSNGQVKNTAPERDAVIVKPQCQRAFLEPGEQFKRLNVVDLTGLGGEHKISALPSERKCSPKPKGQQVPVPVNNPVLLTNQPAPADPRDGDSHNADDIWSGPPAKFEERHGDVSGMEQQQPELAGSQQVIGTKPVSAKMLKRKYLDNARSEVEGKRLRIQPCSSPLLTPMRPSMGNRPISQEITEKLPSKLKAALAGEVVGILQSQSTELSNEPCDPGEPD